MMYHFMTKGDETEVLYSHIMEKDGVRQVEVHFERPTQQGFDSARCVLPSYCWKFIEGFSDEEILRFNEFLRHNAQVIFRSAARVIP